MGRRLIPTYTDADLLFVAVATVVWLAFAVDRPGGWVVGVLVWAVLIVRWCTRTKRYAAIPGTALGVLLAWTTLGVGDTYTRLYYLTALGAAVGASINAIVFRCYRSGLFGLFVVALAYWIAHLC